MPVGFTVRIGCVLGVAAVLGLSLVPGPQAAAGPDSQAAGPARQTAAGQPAPRNDCRARYWRFTLRCQVDPRSKPQPNFGVGPGSPEDIEDFTRVFLTGDPTVRALDGTVPTIYVDKAVCTDPGGCGRAAYGDPVESNRWMFTVPGGGACNAEDTDGNLVVDDASWCVERYLDPAEQGEMGTSSDPPTKEMTGIHRPDPGLNPVFAGYNRIRIEKSSYDRNNGEVAYQSQGGYFTYVLGGRTLHFDLYQQGYRFFEEAFRALGSGLTYTTWVPDGSGGVTETTETLPPLQEAETVLLVGHSDGAHGLFHIADRLAGVLAGMPGFTADVRAVFDANFLPSAEAEARYATDDFGDPLDGDAYTDQWAGNTSGSGVPFAYDGAVHYSTGRDAQEFASWGAQPDQSCVQAHSLPAGDGETWKCHDRHHVLFNHISTPFFFREDFTDPGSEHTANGAGHMAPWGEWASYPWCVPGLWDPCPPRFDLAEHRERLENQAQTLLDDAGSRSELATGADPSLAGVGGFPTFYAWMPECHTHNGAYDDESFYETRIAYLDTDHSMREWLERFITADRTDLRGWRIDGWTDAEGNVMLTDSPNCLER